MTNIKKTRIEWLDAAKGIGILLVIAAHCMNIEKWPFQIIYVFHMPLFFCLSGFVFRESRNWISCFKKSWQTLLIPYGFFFLLGLTVSMIIPEWRSELSVSGVLKDLWLADPNTIHNSSIWFLVCLFWVRMIFWMICRLSISVQAVVCTILYSLGIVYSRHRVEIAGFTRLPFDLDVVPVALFFFLLGYWACRYRWLDAFVNERWKALVLCVSGLMILILSYHLNGYVNLHGLCFGHPILYLTGGLSGTAMTVGVAMLLVSYPLCHMLKQILKFFGRNSLLIMGIQSLMIRLLIYFCSKRGEALQLYYLPWHHTVVFTVLVAFVISPVLCLTWNKIRIYAKEKMK